MVTIKVKFRPSNIAGQPGNIYYSVISQRKCRQLLSDFKIFREEWDCRRGRIVVPDEPCRASQIINIRKWVRCDVELLARITREFEAEGIHYTTDDLFEKYNDYRTLYSLSTYMNRIIAAQRLNGRIRTSETYSSALGSFIKFRGGEDIMLNRIDSYIMEQYESWLKRNGLTSNSISFYMRILRAVYNRAVNEGAVEDCKPFRTVYTGVDKTVKRALPLRIIKKIANLDLSNNPKADYARDMFIMSFFLRGMSFVDMSFLKKSDLRNGSIIYRRRKTGRQLIICWEPEMQKILDKYPENPTDYLLPIITNSATNERNIYRNKGYNINYSLKKIAEIVGVKESLTLYVARHSWASAAKTSGVPLNVISEGMGHESEKTTEIYLASLENSVVDKANEFIISRLKSM